MKKLSIYIDSFFLKKINKNSKPTYINIYENLYLFINPLIPCYSFQYFILKIKKK